VFPLAKQERTLEGARVVRTNRKTVKEFSAPWSQGGGRLGKGLICRGGEEGLFPKGISLGKGPESHRVTLVEKKTGSVLRTVERNTQGVGGGGGGTKQDGRIQESRGTVTQGEKSHWWGQGRNREIYDFKHEEGNEASQFI